MVARKADSRVGQRADSTAGPMAAVKAVCWADSKAGQMAAIWADRWVGMMAGSTVGILVETMADYLVVKSAPDSR